MTMYVCRWALARISARGRSRKICSISVFGYGQNFLNLQLLELLSYCYMWNSPPPVWWISTWRLRVAVQAAWRRLQERRSGAFWTHPSQLHVSKNFESRWKWELQQWAYLCAPIFASQLLFKYRVTETHLWEDGGRWHLPYYMRQRAMNMEHQV